MGNLKFSHLFFKGCNEPFYKGIYLFNIWHIFLLRENFLTSISWFCNSGTLCDFLLLLKELWKNKENYKNKSWIAIYLLHWIKLDYSYNSCNNVALPYFTIGYLPGEAPRNIKILKIGDGYVIAATHTTVIYIYILHSLHIHCLVYQKLPHKGLLYTMCSTIKISE